MLCPPFGGVMKNTLFCAAIVVLTCAFAVGQQYKVLYSFLGASVGDGAYAEARLAVDDAGNLYGTTLLGGTFGSNICYNIGCGTVFELSPVPGGTWTETTLYAFCGNYNGYHCPDGDNPEAGLVLDKVGNLYGTTRLGGSEPCPGDSEGCGTVFELSPPSAPGGAWTYTVLYNFCTSYPYCPDGEFPVSDLVFDASGNLYGTTIAGGAIGYGTVFELSPGSGGWTETVLYSFCSVRDGTGCLDGAEPYGGPSFDPSGNLYGTTTFGGQKNGEAGGVVYKLSPSSGGWSETVLHAFPNTLGLGGGAPQGTVSLDQDGNVYSTVEYGEYYGVGGAFRIGVSSDKESTAPLDQSNGQNPVAGLLIDPANNDLYGTASIGGLGYGTVFRISGRKIAALYEFGGGSDGAYPLAAVTAGRSKRLYGTTSEGGVENCSGRACGVVFEITP
jgi:uncharacterized repeat protein (TIGR03803 family)